MHHITSATPSGLVTRASSGLRAVTADRPATSADLHPSRFPEHQPPAGHDGAATPAVSIKRKIAFAMIMGVITTGVISFTLISLNLGFNERFLRIWLRSWAVGYIVAIPAILILSPVVQRAVDSLFEKSARPAVPKEPTRV
jgi:hypothetical protein